MVPWILQCTGAGLGYGYHGTNLDIFSCTSQGPAEKNVFTVQKTSTSKTGNVCPPVARASTLRRCPACPTKCVEGMVFQVVSHRGVGWRARCDGTFSGAQLHHPTAVRVGLGLGEQAPIYQKELEVSDC
jgi:hypothetical protein